MSKIADDHDWCALSCAKTKKQDVSNAPHQLHKATALSVETYFRSDIHEDSSGIARVLRTSRYNQRPAEDGGETSSTAAAAPTCAITIEDQVHMPDDVDGVRDSSLSE